MAIKAPFRYVLGHRLKRYHPYNEEHGASEIWVEGGLETPKNRQTNLLLDLLRFFY